MRIDNQPYGRLNEIIYDQAFTVHPYKHPTIGSMEDLEAASIDDVRDFFHTYYVPSNATRRARRRLRHEGGAGARHPVSRARAEGRRAGAARHPEGAAADRRSGASRSRRPGRCRRSSSRTTSRSTAIRTRIRCTSRRRCCRTARARASTGSWSTRSSWRWRRSAAANIIEDPNLFYAVAIVQPGHTPEEAIDALIAELDRLRNEPISGGELQQAKNQFARDYIFGRESNKDKASQLGACRRHPQRHQDGRRRVRHLHEHHARPTSSASRASTSRRRTGS